MLEIKRAQNEVASSAEEGSVIAEVQVSFSGGMSPNDARHAGKGALLVAIVEELDPRIVHDAVDDGGHSTIRSEDRFLQPMPINQRFNNTLQELPDGTSIQMSELKNPKLLNDAPKPALVVGMGQDLGGGVSRIVVMNVFTPSERPEDFGIRRINPVRRLKRAA